MVVIGEDAPGEEVICKGRAGGEEFFGEFVEAFSGEGDVGLVFVTCGADDVGMKAGEEAMRWGVPGFVEVFAGVEGFFALGGGHAAPVVHEEARLLDDEGYVRGW